MRRFVDLHTHTTASDGVLPPDELIRRADAAGLAAVAITDHDTADSLPRARQAVAQFPDLRLVGGIEVSAVFPHGTMHILGLRIDENAPPLAAMLEQLRQTRLERNPRIVQRLGELGMRIDMADVQEASIGHREGRNTVLGRLHIALALVRKGYVATTEEAFERFIGQGRPAYVDKERLWPREVIAAIRQGGGLPVLAHPVQLDCRNRLQLETVLRGLIHDGLGGIEVYHPSHDDIRTRQYLDLAKRFALVITGGSDYHGLDPSSRLGRPRVPACVVEDSGFSLAE